MASLALIIIGIFQFAFLILPWLSFFTAWDACLAQEEEVTTLDPVLVTGTARPIQLRQATQSITIIDEKQFIPLQPNRVPAILQQVPGLHIDEMGAPGGLSSLYLRGADPNFTLALLDGIPLNDSTNQRGGSVDLSILPIERIERVEIVRGPLSSFYGGEGMAGAINFITRTPDPSLHIRLLGEGGRFDTTREIVQAGGALGPVATNLSLAHSRTEEQVNKDRFSLTSIGWNMAPVSSSQWDFRLNGQYSDSRTKSFPEGSGGPRLAVLQDTEKRDTQEFSTGMVLSSAENTEWQHRLLMSFLRRSQTISTPGILSSGGAYQLPPAQFETVFYRLQGRLTETWALSPQWVLSLGGQLSYEQGKRDGSQDLSTFGGSSNASSDFSLDRYLGGIFTEMTWSPTDAWIINSGIRLDLSEGFEPRISPRLGTSFQVFPWLKIRGGYGKGFKVPSMASLVDPQIGNRTLEPETSTGWDVGLQAHTTEHTLTASVEYFHNKFRHLIDLDPSLLAQGIFQLTNLQGTTTKGIEGALTLAPFRQVSLQGSLTYLKTHITGTDEPLRNRPKWQGGLTLTAIPHPTLTLYGRITWVGSSRDFQVPTQTTDVGGYTKIDLTITYHTLKAWNWYAAIENLTNTSYEAFEGFPAPPLTFRFGLEYRLSYS